MIKKFSAFMFFVLISIPLLCFAQTAGSESNLAYNFGRILGMCLFGYFGYRVYRLFNRKNNDNDDDEFGKSKTRMYIVNAAIVALTIGFIVYL